MVQTIGGRSRGRLDRGDQPLDTGGGHQGRRRPVRDHRGHPRGRAEGHRGHDGEGLPGGDRPRVTGRRRGGERRVVYATKSRRWLAPPRRATVHSISVFIRRRRRTPPECGLLPRSLMSDSRMVRSTAGILRLRGRSLPGWICCHIGISSLRQDAPHILPRSAIRARPSAMA